MTEMELLQSKPYGTYDLFFYRGVITKVIDGDTLEVDIDLGCNVWLRGERCRLRGINTPEMTGAEKASGMAAKQYVEAIVAEEGSEVFIRTDKDKKCKYGRWMVTVWTGNASLSINKRLLNNGMAKEYLS